MSKAAIDKKAELTNLLVDKLKNAKSFLVFEYLGLSVKELTAMRHQIHGDKATIEIVKNNILNRALKAINVVPNFEDFSGPNALVLANEDEVVGFRTIHKIMEKHKFVKFKIGFLENKVVTNDQFAQIASIPGRKGLYSMLLSCLVGPIRNLLYGLNALKDTKNKNN